MDSKNKKKARLQLELPLSILSDADAKNTTIREPTNENTGTKMSNPDEMKLKVITIEFLDPDKSYPLIWHIKQMILQRFNISIESQLLYSGSGIQVYDTKPFSE